MAEPEDSVIEQDRLDNIHFYQDVLHKEVPDSPLYHIREKELEISGRVLAAKKKAEQIVADARRKATETMATAEADGEAAAREVEARIIADAEREAATILANVENEVAEVRAQAEAHRDAAVRVVVRAVSSI